MASVLNEPTGRFSKMARVALFYGSFMQFIIILLIALSYLMHLDRFENQAWFSSLFLLLLFFTLLFSFQSYTGQSFNEHKEFTQLVLLSVMIGIIIASIGYAIYFIEATYIDPEYAQKAMESSRKYWLANNYSNVAIAGQIELSNSFHNPAKWGFFSGLFILGLTCTIGITLAAIISFLHPVIKLIHHPKQKTRRI